MMNYDDDKHSVAKVQHLPQKCCGVDVEGEKIKKILIYYLENNLGAVPVQNCLFH